MARDLIPPSSPAGRPNPDGVQYDGGVPNLIELPPEPARSPAQPAQAPAYTPSAFRNRFGFLVGALAGVVVAAVMVAVVVVWQDSGDPAEQAGLAKNWSKWQPSDSSINDGAVQIADHVAREYMQGGKQLVTVTANPIADGLNVALQPSSGNITPISGPAIVYELAGLAKDGSILGGKPSPQRLQVLHREALELSLYSFRYLPDVEMVVVMLPPPPASAEASATASPTPTAGSTTLATATDANSPCVENPNGTNPCKSALFYRPGDLRQQLQMPLGFTLKAKAPSPDDLSPSEAKAIDSLTLPNKFLWLFQQQQGRLVLVRP
jgi:hypothetical protein